MVNPPKGTTIASNQALISVWPAIMIINPLTSKIKGSSR